MRYRHASGDDEDGCVACSEDVSFELSGMDPCTQPEPDPAEPDLCRWCSHTVQEAA